MEDEHAGLAYDRLARLGEELSRGRAMNIVWSAMSESSPW